VRINSSTSFLVVGITVLIAASQSAFSAPRHFKAAVHHILLISIDGFHSIDLFNFIRSHPDSALAKLSGEGTTFANAHQITPDDSFPGMTALATGGSPQTTGVWYDVTYDRKLLQPGGRITTSGTVVVYTEDTDRNPHAVDGGGGIDPDKLPYDPITKQPVYPHTYVRVNTIFELIHAAGVRTAWCDKHPAYELLNGPSGTGIDDLFAPEVDADRSTSSLEKIEVYDDTKVKAVLNEIDGKDHTGEISVGTPAIFGMNFQAVSVGEKLADGGYSDDQGTPSSRLESAIVHTDGSIGKFVKELWSQDLYHDTAIIITAKHGQEPLDRSQRRLISEDLIPSIVNGVEPGLLGQATQDCGALIWLTDPSKTLTVVAALRAHSSELGIKKILYGPTLAAAYDNPATDSRTPDIIVITRTGVIIAGTNATKLSEHGGFDDDNTHVALLVEARGTSGGTVITPVTATQVAPTILLALGIDPQGLQAVQIEKTQALPGLPF
jgi:hypothetical protein